MFPALEALIRPGSVAVIGASDKPGSLGFHTYKNVRYESNISGPIYAVNPRLSQIFDDACYPSIRDVPEPDVDVAIVVVAAKFLPEVVSDCAESGVKFALLLSSGFAEIGSDGAAMQDRLRKIADDSGMHLYGPNAPGLTNVRDRVLLSMSPAAKNDTRPGGIGLATQGGGLGRTVMQWMDRGMGISLWCSPGNESDLDVCDFLNFMVHDPETTVLGTVIEGFSHTSAIKFMKVAATAQEVGKPLVALKVGRSQYGVRAAQSHTAAMAGNDEVVDAVFRRYGVIRVDDIDELAEIVSLLDRAPVRENYDPCIYTFSGGTASLAADLVGTEGLRLAELDDETVNKLESVAPSFGFVDNPIDLTTRALTEPELNRTCLDLVATDKNVGTIIFAMPADYGEITVDACQDLIDISSQCDKLVLPVWMSPRQHGGYELLEANALPPFHSLRGAVRALRRVQARIKAKDASGSKTEYGRDRAARAFSYASRTSGPVGKTRQLNEVESKEILSSIGVSVPAETFATNPTAAVRAANAIGYPVAMKVVSPIAHKTEVGGVKLNVSDSVEVEAGYEELVDNLRRQTPNVEIEGVLVSEMIDGDMEMLVGIHHDEAFGPVLTVGVGGRLTEVVGDVARTPLPVTADVAGLLLTELQHWQVLSGYRDQPAFNIGELIRTMVSLSDFVLENDLSVYEIEVNPLILNSRSTEKSCVAVDAMVTVLDQENGG